MGPEGNPAQSDNGANSLPATGAHPGGVDALFAGSGVKFIKDSINRTTW